MNKSQSLPGLGKGMSPLRGYLGFPRSVLSPEEVEAEQPFYALASASITRVLFKFMERI